MILIDVSVKKFLTFYKEVKKKKFFMCPFQHCLILIFVAIVIFRAIKNSEVYKDILFIWNIWDEYIIAYFPDKMIFRKFWYQNLIYYFTSKKIFPPITMKHLFSRRAICPEIATKISTINAKYASKKMSWNKILVNFVF